VVFRLIRYVLSDEVEKLHSDGPGQHLIDPHTGCTVIPILNPRTCGSLGRGLLLAHRQCPVAVDPVEGPLPNQTPRLVRAEGDYYVVPSAGENLPERLKHVLPLTGFAQGFAQRGVALHYES
jgi:hypothetical protein